MVRLNLDGSKLGLQKPKKKKKIKLKKEGLKPFPVELLADPKEPEDVELSSAQARELTSLAAKETSQPALLSKAFGKKGAAIQKKAIGLTREVVKAEGLDKKGFFDDEAVQTAAIGLVPILLGGLLGGSEGALAGVQAGAAGIGALQKGKAAVKETELKERELDIKAEAEAGKGDLRQAQAGLARAQAAKFDPARLAAELENKQRETASKLSEGLRREFFQATKEVGTADVLASHARITEVASQPASAAGDIALVFNFMKMNDPASTVREGEFATAENARGIPESVKNVYNKAISGILLTSNQRLDFVGQADNLVKGQLEAQRRIDDRFESLAIKQQVDPTLVVDPEFEKIRSQIASQRQGKKIIGEVEAKVKGMSATERKSRADELRKKAGL